MSGITISAMQRIDVICSNQESIIESIEFSPAVAGTDIIWQDQFGNQIGTGGEIEVFPGGNVTYTAGASLCGSAGDWCGFEGGIEGDDVNITFEELELIGESTDIVCYNLSNGTINAIAPSNGEWEYNLYMEGVLISSQISSSDNFVFEGLSPGIYSVTIMEINKSDFLCSNSDWKKCPKPNLPEYAFIGRSNVGKSSLINKIIESDKNNFELSISATTRSRRDGEIHGKDYFFISDEEFDELKNNKAFIEHAEVHGYQYGTLESFINERLAVGVNVILDIDVQGFNQIKEVIKDTISIFIIPPSIEELKKRLTKRGLDSDDVIRQRLINAKTELQSAELFDYIILNQDFDKALDEILSIILRMDYESNESNINILKDLLD